MGKTERRFKRLLKQKEPPHIKAHLSSQAIEDRLQYQEEMGFKRGEEVVTPKGKGRIQKLNLVRGEAKIKLNGTQFVRHGYVQTFPFTGLSRE